MRNATVSPASLAESILFTKIIRPMIAHWNRFAYAWFRWIASLPSWWLLLWAYNNSFKFIHFHAVFVPFSIVFVQSHQVLIYSFDRFWLSIVVAVAFAISSLNGFGFILWNNTKYSSCLQRQNNESREQTGSIQCSLVLLAFESLICFFTFDRNIWNLKLYYVRVITWLNV